MDKLIQLLRDHPNDPSIPDLIKNAEAGSDVDLNQQSEQLSGVWELRWSSSQQPWLKQTAGLENLQALDPERGRGCNLLRLRAPFTALGGISLQAELKIAGSQRVAVYFQRGGWRGPSRANHQPLSWMRQVQQSTPAWLDITVLDDQLRVCRGNAGTSFALLRRRDLNLSDLLGV